MNLAREWRSTLARATGHQPKRSFSRSCRTTVAPGEAGATLLGAGALPLSVGLDHAAAAGGLPWHHRDPFDRLLVAQAQIERATVASRDAAFAAYGVPVVW